ncbi:MAG TPA: PQQ-binding-like beta-propeller repeat protein [Candidatus Didemnitutus sp.]|nr:PQQ-binding-like beta-propeller repeat protein [Candidatus Didemnitutus sp.]
MLAGVVRLTAAAGNEWTAYLGDKSASHYSSLSQIGVDNVKDLTVAWTWQGGEARPDTSQIQCNPLMIGGVLYLTNAQMKLIALDAATGKEKWRFAPAEPNGVNRGLAYWSDGDDRRILYGNGHWLHAIDAASGKLIDSFGDHGRVDLANDLGRDVRGLAIQANTPGVIYRDLIILSTRVGEGPAPAAPGHVRAYNVRTGKLAWIFHAIPYPGEPGYEAWPPDAWKHLGGVNAWPGMTVDEERGLVFCPIGSATFDFWGGDRLGNDEYADSLVVLEAATGKLVWHFQFTHHDLWDRDPPAPPTLLTVHRNGQDIPAVAQVTKSGHVWVFNRVTGEHLFPYEEIAVPSSDLAGEVASPTQPVPLKPAAFARQFFSENEITNRTPEAHRAVLERYSRVRAFARFTPPSREGTIILPGFDGGAEWGGAAADPDGILYVNSSEMAWILSMIDAGGATTLGQQVYLQNCTGCHGADRKGNAAANIPSLLDLSKRRTRAQVVEVVTKGRAVMPSWAFLGDAQRDAVVSYIYGDAEPQRAPVGEGAWQTYLPDQQVGAKPPPFTHTGYNRWLDPDGYPAIKPPWGTLNAINLNTGEYVWTIPLGEFPELTAKGVPPTGVENYGGPLVTAGNLVFVAATRDEMFRAFDRRTGRELWKVKLPVAGYATPATYEVGGRQYVVIACGGGKLGTKSGDTYLAFALPAR